MSYLTDVRSLESVQSRWTREAAVVGYLSYKERLKTLKLLYVWQVAES